MLFDFLKYLQPTSYFQLYRKTGQSIYPVVSDLPEEILAQLDMDDRFGNAISQDYDLSWQAITKGYIGNVQTYKDFKNVSVKDNYIFIRKYFHPAWVLYVCIIRILSFKNPIVEFRSWFGTRHITKVNNVAKHINYKDWENYESKLVGQSPKVTVIIPTLNRYKFLKDILSDLEGQAYKNFEVIIVDQSDNFKPSFYTSYNLEINLIRQEEKALWLARNTAIKAAKGDFIALSEDDVRIDSDWILKHLKCLDYFNAHVSAGVFYPKHQGMPKERSFFARAFQFATGNAMLYKHVFKSIGMFDRQFEKQRMGDGEFGLRAYLDNVECVSNPYASCVDVKAPSGGLREMGSWDAFRPSKVFAPRPVPSVLYFFRRYFGKRASIFSLLRTIPTSIFSYKLKKNKSVLVLSVFLSLFILPIVLFQVLWSWNLAGNKIKEGHKIEFLM